MTTTNGCGKSYFSRLEYKSVQLSVIPVLGNISEQLTVKFPRPFQLIGFASKPTSLPSDGVDAVYLDSLIIPLDAGGQNTFCQMNASLMIAFMKANQLSAEDIQSTMYIDGDFRYYFTSKLNDDQKPNNYNTFLMPQMAQITYWGEQSSLPSTYPTQDLYRFIKDIYEVSDKRLWGAPGTYAINPQVDPDFWISCACAGGISTARQSLNTLKDPSNIDPTLGVSYFFVNTDGEDYGGIVFGSATVPYAGAGPANPDWAAFPGDFGAAITQWVKDVLLAETGDAEGPTTYTVERVFDVSTCEPCNLGGGIQVQITNSDAYDFGTLALAPGAKYVRVLFSETFAQEPYWSQLNEFIDNFGNNPYLLVA